MDVKQVSNELADFFLEKKKRYVNKTGWAKMRFTEMQLIIITNLELSYNEVAELTGKSRATVYNWRKTNIKHEYLEKFLGMKQYQPKGKFDHIIRDTSLSLAQVVKLTGLTSEQVRYQRSKIDNINDIEEIEKTKGKHRKDISYDNISNHNKGKEYTLEDIRLLVSDKYNNKELAMMLGRNNRRSIDRAKYVFRKKIKNGELVL